MMIDGYGNVRYVYRDEATGEIKYVYENEKSAKKNKENQVNNNKGNGISISHDIEDDEHWINIKCKNVLILKCTAALWNDETAAFTPEIRDAIIESIRKYYG